MRALARMTRAAPVISATVSPRTLMPIRKPPICAGVAVPDMTVAKAVCASCSDRVRPLAISPSQWVNGSNQVIQTADGRVHYNTNETELKRAEYEMELILSCKNNGSGWVIDEARLRKGLAESSDELGAGVDAGWDLGVDVKVHVDYKHSWDHFRHGEPVPQDWMLNKACR